MSVSLSAQSLLSPAVRARPTPLASGVSSLFAHTLKFVVFPFSYVADVGYRCDHLFSFLCDVVFAEHVQRFQGEQPSLS